jgi:3-ketosteroid 9alpha-monooxygenase subunit A
MIMRIDGPMPMIVYSAGTPVEDGTTRFWNSVLIRADGAMDPAVLESVEAGMFHAFHEDHDILARKLPTINPMLVPGDGAFRRVRAWYKQFYMPRAASADIHARVDGDYATDGEIPAPWAARSAA